MNTAFDSEQLGLLVSSSRRGFDFLMRTGQMLPLVIHEDAMQVNQLFVKDEGSNVVETIVGLNETQPWLPFKAAHIVDTDQAFIVRPNVEYVDHFDDEIVPSQALISMRKMCNPVPDFESLSISMAAVNSAITLNSSVIRNRASADYIKCIDFLTSATASATFQSLMFENMSIDSLLIASRDRLEKSFTDAEQKIGFNGEPIVYPTSKDNDWWTLDDLLANSHEQAFAVVRASDGQIIEPSHALTDLWGFPLEEIKPFTPAQFAPEIQLCGTTTEEKMLDVIHKALCKGKFHTMFAHTNAKGKPILCDLWLQRVGHFDDLRVVGHIKKAVETPSLRLQTADK